MPWSSFTVSPCRTFSSLHNIPKMGVADLVILLLMISLFPLINMHKSSMSIFEGSYCVPEYIFL